MVRILGCGHAALGPLAPLSRAQVLFCTLGGSLGGEVGPEDRAVTGLKVVMMGSEADKAEVGVLFHGCVEREHFRHGDCSGPRIRVVWE